MQIIRCSGHHAETLTSIAFASKRFWNYPEHYIEMWRPDLTLEPKWIEENTVYAAQIGSGEIAGFYGISEEDNICGFELEHMWVHPTFIGRGIGKALFQHLDLELRKNNSNGHPSLRIVSDPNAENFYLKLGASRTGDVVPSQPAGRELPVLEYVPKD